MLTPRSLAPRLAATLMALAAPFAAPAQEATTPAPGEPYVAATFTDWTVRCIAPQEDGGPERCEMFQLLRDEDGNAVSVVRMNVPASPAEGQVATAIFMTPIQTRLDPGVRIRIDDGEFDLLPFTFCQPSGCVAEAPVSEAVVDQFRDGTDATVVIFALLLTETGDLLRGDAGEPRAVPVELTASLRGFTAAFEDMVARHEVLMELLAARAAAAAEAAPADQ